MLGWGDNAVQIEQLRKCLAFVLPGPCVGVRAISDVATDRGGATIIEYAFLAGLVALAAVGAFDMMGSAVAGMFNGVSSAFVQSMPKSL